MSIKGDESQNSQGAKVLKLGLNISLSGDPGTDYEIVLDDNGPKSLQSSGPLAIEMSASNASATEKNIQEVTDVHSTGAITKEKKYDTNINLSDSSRESEKEKAESKDLNIIDKIKTTMEHFEKFSDRIKEIPRLRNHPVATSTPFSDKQNSKSESSLVYPEYRFRKFGHSYDFQPRKEYYKGSVRSFPPDLFLKPLPGESFYKQGMYSRYFDFEPYQHYGSESSLNKTSEYKIISTKPKYDIEKYDIFNLPGDQPAGILKKCDSGESGDRQSTSSAESTKDIKIYQSGGILIMQNFKDNLDATEKKEISDFSAKLIENCNKLKDEINSFQMQKPFLKNSADDKNPGKTVQFDLTSVEGQISKSPDLSTSATAKDKSSLLKLDSSESTSDCPKTKDTSPQGTSHSQDFPSLSTQENDSIISNQMGTSPTFVSPKKLEWDSGADIGYMNVDLTKENLSTIERIVLKGLSSDGMSEKNVVYEKKPEKNKTIKSKLILERLPSDLVIEEIIDNEAEWKNVQAFDSNNKEKKGDEISQRVNERKKSKKISELGAENKNLSGTSEELLKGESIFNLEKSKISNNQISNIDKVEQKEKRSCTTDKSVNVNTLWEDLNREISIRQNTETKGPKQTEHCSKVRGLKYIPKGRKLKKKRSSAQRSAPLKEKVDYPRPEFSNSSVEMGLPKKNNKNLEAVPVLNDVELSREVEEIIIDQRFKSKSQESNEKKMCKKALDSHADDKADSKNKGKNKSRPISASSCSNRTVLRKVDKEETKAAVENKFINQIIQTSDLDCESIGIQVFESQVSSDGDFRGYKMREGTKENVNKSSKNIQAFGLNASLPKQLEHPKEFSELITNQNTKSTQFFGGPVNSLPNYHSSLMTNPGASCGRPKILKAKKNLEAEIIRLKEENKKNILANETSKLVDAKTDSRKRKNKENKENLIGKTSTNSKKSQSNTSRKTSKGYESASQNSDKKGNEHPSDKPKKAYSAEGSECLRTSDDVSSLVLTSEVLKVHGDSIDRNIIQEKYFQSQLAEFQMKDMVTRSTSMEMQTEQEKESACKKYMSIGCQYSPKEETDGGRSKYQENDSSREKSNCQGRGTLELYDSSQNIAEECFETLKNTNQEQGLETGDSLPSSTQTAHSWVPGMQNPGENVSGVGRARSFEYLPGHIYESSGNLREELPSETERNIITSSSLDSDTAKRSLSDRTRGSEGRNTLVLENSTESSQDTDRLKILDGNMTQLDLAVLKLREKDAQVQSITRSLLTSLWKKNGSGDCLALAGEADISKSQAMNDHRELLKNERERGDISSSISKEHTKRADAEKEISIACQTEVRSSSSEPEKFYEERKALEKRISEEKKCQIKWIENEIYHLNILRELLEKQSYSKQRKKKHSPVLLSSSDASKSNENCVENISAEIHPRPVTPVYGCTISVTEKALSEVQHPHPHSRGREQGYSQWCRDSQEKQPQYGMALSLSGKDKSKSWRHVVMLPVGVQVSLEEPNGAQECAYDEMENEDISQSHHQYSSKVCTPDYEIPQGNLCKYNEVSHSDAVTQYPSAKRNAENFSSISIQAGFSPIEKCAHCGEENCVCINLEKSYSSPSRSSKSKTSERKGSSKLTSLSEEPELEDGNEDKISDSRNNFKKFSNNASADSYRNTSKPKSAHVSCCQCQKVVEKKSDFPGNYEKHKVIQNPDCRCQNCFIQVSSSISKPDFSCRCPCQSNIYLNIDKAASDFGTCRCSNVQAQKPSKSACHIIKIHGTKCCSPGKGSSCCKSRTASKKMENQSCQTDLITFVPEGSNGRSRTNEVQIEPLDREEPSATKPERRSPEASVLEKERHSSCACCKKVGKEKVKADDHPRHYFLRIEETEVDDDSKESVEQKKSLEVITVTVPVKKAGKAKVYGKKVLETHESYRKNEKLLDFQSKGCNCCSECTAYRSKSTQEYESRSNSNHQRDVAEKPESPRRDFGPCSKQNKHNSYGTPDSFGLDTCTPNELSQEYSPQDYYQRRNSIEFIQSQPYYSERGTNGSHTSQCCKNCNCVKKKITSGSGPEMLSDYDSHKKSKDGNMKEFYRNDAPRFYESNKNPEKQLKASQDGNPGRSSRGWSSESRNSYQEGFDTEAFKHSNDYYNYNKREFMTKSELLKEEKQKRNIHIPSLKEYLTSNRPDFYNSAERRRQIISERAKERVKKHSNRMECLINLIHRCNEQEQASSRGPKRIFTTLQMREQTMKRYKKLPEVTGKLADQKKKEEYRTNKLMADIFAKKLQSEALKGHINLSNSIALLNNI